MFPQGHDKSPQSISHLSELLILHLMLPPFFFFLRFFNLYEGRGGTEGENLPEDSPLSAEPNTGLHLMTHEIIPEPKPRARCLTN